MMLVLSRKTRESVVVGGTAGFERMLKLTVLEISGDRVRLGFAGDRDIPVHRWEVWERLQGNGPAPRTPNASNAGTSQDTAPSADGAAPRPYGLLIVDDEQSVRTLLYSGMRRHGFAVWLAASGREAFDLYERHRPMIDVVLLDVQMPESDGPETLAALRVVNPLLRCCFMSGALGGHSETALRGLNAADIVHKPFGLAEVAQILWELASTADEGLPTS